jgi:hypothetical protein
MGVAFEVIGSALNQKWVEDDLVAFGEELKRSPWGGDGYDRLLIGDINSSLRDWMLPAEYREWQAGHAGGRIAATGAKAFVAKDGLRTAAVLPLNERFSFLMFACHEMVEAALDRRHEAEGHEFNEQTHTSLAHVLWTEYAVERTRRTIADSLNWGFGQVERGFVVEQMKDIERELPGLIQWAVEHNEPPQRLYQLWYEMARVFAMTLGRADAGLAEAKEEVDRFMDRPLIAESVQGWEAFESALRSTYDDPTRAAAAQDETVRDEGWNLLYEQMAALWNKRYDAALG